MGKAVNFLVGAGHPKIAREQRDRHATIASKQREEHAVFALKAQEEGHLNVALGAQPGLEEADGIVDDAKDFAQDYPGLAGDFSLEYKCRWCPPPLFMIIISIAQVTTIPMSEYALSILCIKDKYDIYM